MKDKTCCFTGHRKLPTEKLNKITDELEKTVIGLIADGYLFFGTAGLSVLIPLRHRPL